MSDDMRESVARQAHRMKRACERGAPLVWSSIRVMGMVGWAVAVPTLVGIGLGRWIDHTVRSRISWTLSLLVVGALIGCLNAWYWLGRESRPDESDPGKSE